MLASRVFSVWFPTSTEIVESGVIELGVAKAYFDDSVLTPIGDFRRQRRSLSKGNPGKRRRKKRKRSTDETFSRPSIEPTSPEVLDFVTVGFNTTTRYLEVLAQRCTGSTAPGSTSPGPILEHRAQTHSDSTIQNPLVAIFVPRAEQPKILHSHLPVLIKTASLGSPSLPPIRLVPLASGAENRLIKCLGIPRVGLLGLMGNAPSAAQLIQFTQAHVPAVEIPWLQESISGIFLPTNVNTTQTTTSTEFKKTGRAKDSKKAKND